MNDITMHFLACFLITVVVFAAEFRRRSKKYLAGKTYSVENMIYFHNRIISESIFQGIVWSLIFGVAKEITDIFRSDPQLHDLVADAGGAIFAGIIIWLIGMKWVEWRFR